MGAALRSRPTMQMPCLTLRCYCNGKTSMRKLQTTGAAISPTIASRNGLPCEHQDGQDDNKGNAGNALPVWACGLQRTLLGGAVVEIRIAYWRQFHAMRAQAFNHATVFPGDPTAKPLHIRTARSSQGAFWDSMANGQAGRCWGCILRIFRTRGSSGSRSPRCRGGSSGGWRRRS